MSVANGVLLNPYHQPGAILINTKEAVFGSASLNIDDSQSYVCFENYRPLNDFLLLKTYHDI